MNALMQSYSRLRSGDSQRFSLSRYADTNAASLTKKAPAIRGSNPNIWGESTVNRFHSVRSNRDDFHVYPLIENPIMRSPANKFNATPWRDK